MKLSNDALEKKREYARLWRERNKHKVKEYHKNWRKENKDKIVEYQQNYWEKKAQE